MDALTFYRDLTGQIASSLDIGEALTNTFRYLKSVIDIDLLSLFYFDFMKQRLQCLAEVREHCSEVYFEHPVSCGRLPPKYTYANGLVKEFSDLELPDVEIISDAEREWYFANNPQMTARYGALDLKSLIRVWLHLNKEMVGTLVVAGRSPDVFDDGILELFRMVRDPITVAMSNARRYQELLLLKSRLEEDNRALQRELQHDVGDRPIGIDFGLRGVMEKVRQVAATGSPVLLLGETGTGKEVIANTIHRISDRRSGPMVKVQCGAIPESLLDSELFGHEKGAFTGAITSHRGRFERAEGGTLFLDEIGELTPGAQVKLLRVLQERKIERLGGDRDIDVNVRIIAATNRNLERMTTEGAFREDLWFRLNVFPIHIPPLRLRREDIPSLVTHFVTKKSREMNLKTVPIIEAATLDKLLRYHWPGNVRELQNIIERSLIIHQGPYLDVPDSMLVEPGKTTSPHAMQARGNSGEMFPSLDAVQVTHIREALTMSHGRINGVRGAADLLKMNPSTLRARMRKLGIKFGRNGFVE
ncbi:MAG TPA: sigma 54-interacting transcriptional regulator [bacterium]|nr:sigma 54-interacting transcriptional regulator [bacterium]